MLRNGTLEESCYENNSAEFSLPPNPFEKPWQQNQEVSSTATLPKSTYNSTYLTIQPNPFTSHVESPSAQILSDKKSQRNDKVYHQPLLSHVSISRPTAAPVPVYVNTKESDPMCHSWAVKSQHRNYTSVYMDTRMIASDVFSDIESTLSSPSEANGAFHYDDQSMLTEYQDVLNDTDASLSFSNGLNSKNFIVLQSKKMPTVSNDFDSKRQTKTVPSRQNKPATADEDKLVTAQDTLNSIKNQLRQMAANKDRSSSAIK